MIEKNIAQKLPYPKIEKKEPEFLTLNELKTILCYLIKNSGSITGLRNLLIIMFLAFLGIRLSALIKLDIFPLVPAFEAGMALESDLPIKTVHRLAINSQFCDYAYNLSISNAMDRRHIHF